MNAVGSERVLQPAPWMSFRSWIDAGGEALSLLSDERHHQLATLDGASSKLWARIERGVSYAALEQLAADLGVVDQLETFVEMLVTQAFVSDSAAPPTAAMPLQRQVAPPPKLLEDAENVSVEHDVIAWVAAAGHLFAAHWEVTYRCNERCVHCYNPGAAHLAHERAERDTDELTPSEAQSLLDDLRDAGVFRLTLSGGEVMLRRDFWEIVEGARARGFSVNVYTNGLKLGDEAVERLAALWPTTVSISVYSDDAPTHDAITRVPGSLTRSTAALRALHEHGVKTFLKSTAMDHTVGGYQRVRQLALDVGAGPEIDMMMSASVDGASAPLGLAAKQPEELVVLAATPGSPLFVGDASTGWGRIDRDPNATVCGAGIGSVGIDPSGGINTCNSMPIPAGSHRVHGFLNVWRASAVYRKAHLAHEPAPSVEGAVELLSRWQDVRLRDFHECGTHRRCGWCSKCPGLAMLEHGDPLGPSTTNCRLATARMTAADLLASGLDRGEIAARLDVPVDFGARRPRRLPVLSEQRRGTGFSPVGAAVGVLAGDSAVAESSRPRVALRDPAGGVLLHGGTEDTAEAVSSFAAVFARAQQV
jgi:MoaA/NifB/PqqE/SkfB family radical SAM enzyme